MTDDTSRAPRTPRSDGTKYTVPPETMDAAIRALRDLLRTELVKKEYALDDGKTFLIGLAAESDRALPVVAFSFIDENLKAQMVRHFYPGIKGGTDSLFENFGPLSTASARIKVAAGLHWLRPDTYRDLEVLRKIRNAFAHRSTLLSFDDNEIRSLVDSLSPREAAPWPVLHKSLPERSSVTPRVLYHVRAALVYAAMLQEITSAPIALGMGLPPGAAFEDGYDAIPEMYKDLMRAAIDTLVEVVNATPPTTRGAPNQRL